MEIQTILQNLIKEVSCSLCQDILHDPRQLPCLHSCCLKCLNDLSSVMAPKVKMECPVCRRENAVPECGTFEALPSSFYLNSLLDVLAIKQYDTSQVICGNCEKKSQESCYCFDCGSFWCQRCKVSHDGLRPNEGHRMLALMDFQAGDFEDVLKRQAFCSRQHHEKEVLKYYCKTCQETACQVCLNIKHGRHDVEHLEVASKENKSKIMVEVEKVKEKTLEYEEGIRKIDERSNNIEQQVEALKRDVYEFVEELIVSLHQLKQELITKAENEGKRSLERLEDQKNQIHNELRKIESAVQQTQSVVQRSTSAEIVQCTQNLKQNIQKLVGQELCLCPSENIHFHFSSNRESLSAVEIGRLQISRTCPTESTAEGKGMSEAFAGLETNFMVVTRNETGGQNYCQGDRVAVEFKRREDRHRIEGVQIEDDENGTYSVSYFVKEPGQYDMSVMVNGKPVGGMPFEPVQVKPRTFKTVMSIGRQGTNPGEFRKPWGVAVNERDEIAIADLGNNRIQVLSSEGGIIRSFGKAGSDDGEFKGPCDVTWGGKGEIIVSDSGNHRIQLFSGAGEFIKAFGREGNLDGDLCFPHGVTTDSSGNIVVSDTGNKRVQMFTPEGQFLFKLGRDGILFCPMSCVFFRDHFIVSDFHDHHVKIFNKEGDFLYKFGTKGQMDGGFNCPAGLAIDKSGNLLVCDRGNCRVQLFKLDGTFQGKFGSFGSELGQFLFPCSLSVLTSGKLVVSDLENSRLQIIL